MSSELKPCPFCGEADVALCHRDDNDGWGKTWSIECSECEAEINTFFQESDCVAAWNRRTHEPATKAVLANIVKILAEQPGPYAKAVSLLVPDREAFLREQGVS